MESGCRWVDITVRSQGTPGWISLHGVRVPLKGAVDGSVISYGQFLEDAPSYGGGMCNV